MKQKKSLKFKIFTGIIALLVVITSSFFIYVNNYYKASTFAIDSLKSDNIVSVEENGDIVFKPKENPKNIGFIFYPGAKVEAAAYAPLAKEIAAKGYTVVIAKMKYNLAILSPNRADDIIAKYNEIDTWAIGGHSLGGVMACDYALNSDKIKGLVLLASYPKDKRDFTDKDISVLSIWGSNDKVADLNKVKKAKGIMPINSEFLELYGGNHAGFAGYGVQKGDGEATITNKVQIENTSKYIVKLLEGLK
ncbi:MAG: alpha/beta hydrolase [Clostridium sp.]